MSEAVNAERESELKGGLNRLESAACDLCGLVGELGSMLAPVMRETEPSPTAETKQQVVYSPTGQQITAIAAKVTETKQSVREIMKHLEV